MFDGTRKQYQVFYQQLTAKVENNRDDFDSDKRLCNYAFARLKGTAATLMLPYMNQMRASGAWSFDQLLGFFDQMFGDPNKEERARDKLWSMSQGKKNICNYVMGFQEQLLLSNSTLDEDTKMMIFRKGLSHKLQDKLIVRSQAKDVRSQAKDSRKAKVEQGEFDEELSEQEGRLSL
jgi:hypothetical protein